MQEIAAQLRARKARITVTNAAIADAAGMSGPQVSKVFTGKKHVDVEQLDRICIFLGLNIADVIAKAEKLSARRHYEA